MIEESAVYNQFDFTQPISSNARSRQFGLSNALARATPIVVMLGAPATSGATCRSTTISRRKMAIGAGNYGANGGTRTATRPAGSGQQRR